MQRKQPGRESPPRWRRLSSLTYALWPTTGHSFWMYRPAAGASPPAELDSQLGGFNSDATRPGAGRTRTASPRVLAVACLLGQFLARRRLAQ